MKRIGIWILISTLSVFATSCADTPPTGNGGDGGNGSGVDLSASTKVLNTTTLQGLETVSEDQSMLTFRKGGSQLEGFRVGDIMVSDVAEPLLPYGMLRRIEAVEETGDRVVIRTGETGLAQAIENGELHTRIPLTLAEGIGGGKLVPSLAGPGQLIFPFNDVVLFDGDKNEDTTNDQIIMNGNLTLEPEIIIDIEISNFTLQKAAIEVVGDASASITIEARREAKFEYEDVLLTVPFPKVVIPIGPIPVVFVPILEIRGGANGSFSAGITADIQLDADTRVGLGYDGSFGPILEVEPSGSAGVPNFLDGASADGEVWLSARFKVAVYGLAGVYVESRFYGKAHVAVDECPWWTLRAGVAGSAGAYAGISAELLIFDADIKIFEWQTQPLKEEIQVAQAEGCAPSVGQDVSNWARSYGAESLDFPIGMAVTADGGAVITGSTYSFTPQTDAFLMKIDPLGHVAWQIGFDDLEAGVAVAPVADGFYLLAGDNSVSSLFSPPFVPDDLTDQAGDPPSYLLRLNSNGESVWAKALAASDALDASAMGVLQGGDVVVAGTIGDPPGSEDVWVSRFNSAGAVVWTRRIGSAAVDDDVQSMIVDSSGNVVVLATSAGGDLCDWVIKFDPDGNVLWQACYSGEHNDWAAQMVEVPGGYVIIGHLDIHAQLNRIDYEGNLVWARHIDSDGIDRDADTGRELQPDKTPYDSAYVGAAYADGEILVGGKRGLGEESDFWVTRLNSEGAAEWMRAYGGAREDAAGGFSEFARLASTLAVTPDGGAMIAGFTSSFSHAANVEAYDLDVWVVKIRALGTVNLDDGSGAFSNAIGGEIDSEIQHFRMLTTAEAASFDLLLADFTPVVYSTSFDVARQGGIE